MKPTLHLKLTAIFFLLFLITSVIALIIGFYIINSWTTKDAHEMIKSDLKIAHQIYQHKIEEIQTILEYTALRSKTIREPLIEKDKKTLFLKLDEVRKLSGLDILIITDEKGNVFVRSNNLSVSGDNILDNEIAGFAVMNIKTVSGTTIISYNKIIREGNGILKKLNPVQTKNSSNSKGILIAAACPVLDENRDIIGILFGGCLLNNDSKIVNQAENIIFQDETYLGRELGVINIFGENISVATSKKNQSNFSLTSDKTIKNIYDEITYGNNKIKNIYLGKDRYITAYEPIKNINGEIIGMLSTGILEKKFIDLKKQKMIKLTLVIAIIILMTLTFYILLSKSLLKPFGNLVHKSKQIVGDNNNSQLKTSEDEIGIIENAFNSIVSSIKERELEIVNVHKEINRSKRLSTLGQLAAGVAHEINNPLGGIVVYSNLLLEDTSPDDPRFSNIEKIIRESNRCKNIIRGLLDFARQTPPKLDPENVNNIIKEALDNIKSEKIFENIKIIENLDINLPKIMVDSSQIQEVFENIIRNAAEVIKGMGELKIISRLADNEYCGKMIEILFKDTGPGILPDDIDRIFEPFFTTKRKGHGTGLGLAVSRSIIERHNGNILVESLEGSGTTFIVQLPLKEEKP